MNISKKRKQELEKIIANSWWDDKYDRNEPYLNYFTIPQMANSAKYKEHTVSDISVNFTRQLNGVLMIDLELAYYPNNKEALINLDKNSEWINGIDPDWGTAVSLKHDNFEYINNQNFVATLYQFLSSSIDTLLKTGCIKKHPTEKDLKDFVDAINYHFMIINGWNEFTD